MPADTDVTKRCNFFSSAPEWVACEQESKTVVQRLPTIPDDGHLYWVGGAVVLADGRQLSAVFVTTGRGELHAAFWHVAGTWLSHDDPELSTHLGSPGEELFPFQFKFNVPVERDAFHTLSSNSALQPTPTRAM